MTPTADAARLAMYRYELEKAAELYRWHPTPENKRAYDRLQKETERLNRRKK